MQLDQMTTHQFSLTCLDRVEIERNYSIANATAGTRDEVFSAMQDLDFLKAFYNEGQFSFGSELYWVAHQVKASLWSHLESSGFFSE